MKTVPITTLLVWLAVLVCLAVLLSQMVPTQHRVFVSPEVNFTDDSKSGLAIMPASCASHPSYFHSALAGSGDGYGYIVYNGQGEIGAYAPYAGNYVCVTYNGSGQTVFIPARTAGELNNFKAYRPAGVTVY